MQIKKMKLTDTPKKRRRPRMPQPTTHTLRARTKMRPTLRSTQKAIEVIAEVAVVATEAVASERATRTGVVAAEMLTKTSEDAANAAIAAPTAAAVGARELPLTKTKTVLSLRPEESSSAETAEVAIVATGKAVEEEAEAKAEVAIAEVKVVSMAAFRIKTPLRRKLLLTPKPLLKLSEVEAGFGLIKLQL